MINRIAFARRWGEVVAGAVGFAPRTESASRQLVSDADLTVTLADGRRIAVPLAWYPRLLNASSAEHQNWRLLGNGYAVEWPDLDEHIGVEGILAGRMSGESRQSFDRWLSQRRTKASGTL